MNNIKKNELMISDGLDDDGCGLEARDVVRAVQVWSVLHPEMTQTVKEAAHAFNLSPEFLAKCIRDEESPFFFLSEVFGDMAPVERLRLEHDGY